MPNVGPRESALEKSLRVLVVGSAWVGDMVIAQSLFKFLSQRHPGARIDVVAPAWTAPLLARMPEVHAALLLPVEHGDLKLGLRWGIGRGLRDRHYDWAIVLPGSFKSALLPFAARARRRTGYLGELRYGLLNDVRRLDRDDLRRTIDRFVALGLEPGATLPRELPLPELWAQPAESTLQRLNIRRTSRPVLGLCPGAEYGSAKRWPAAYFAEVARAKRRAGWDIWLFGSARDASTSAEVQRLSGEDCVDLAGRTSLGEAVDLLALCDAVLTNDSGLMHVAAALKRPMVAVYGSSDPRHTPPLSERATVLSLNLPCSPCFQRECPLGHLDCLRQLRPEKIITALAQRGGQAT